MVKPGNRHYAAGAIARMALLVTVPLCPPAALGQGTTPVQPADWKVQFSDNFENGLAGYWNIGAPASAGATCAIAKDGQHRPPRQWTHH
jgi:hypothetical protein